MEKGHAARRFVKLCLQKPVDGRGLTARHLGKPLRGAASRRGQLRLEPQRVKQPQNAGHDRRFARAGAAGHDQKLPGGRRADGAALLRRVIDALPVLNFCDQIVDSPRLGIFAVRHG